MVIWNHTMDFAVGHTTDMDREDFEQHLLDSHIKLTGEELDLNDGAITEKDSLYRFEM